MERLATGPLARALQVALVLGRSRLTEARMERWWRGALVCEGDGTTGAVNAGFSRFLFERLRASGAFERMARACREGNAALVAARLEALARIGAARSRRWERLRRAGGPPPLMEAFVATCTACDLRCPGCYALDEQVGPPADEARIHTAVAALHGAGAAAVHFVGKGEPFLDAAHGLALVRTAERWPQLLFTLATNGLRLSEALVEAVARPRNLVLLVSVDGPEAAHDARRGPGAYRRTLEAMDRLRRRGALFAFACTVTAANVEQVTAAPFLSAMRAAGCSFGLYSRLFHAPNGRCGRGEPDGDGLRLHPEQATAFAAALVEAERGCEMPLVDFDALEARTGCRARAGLSVYVDAVRGRESPCIRVPFGPEACSVDAGSGGDPALSLRAALAQPFFEAYRRGTCAAGTWCGADLSAERSAVAELSRA